MKPHRHDHNSLAVSRFFLCTTFQNTCFIPFFFPSVSLITFYQAVRVSPWALKFWFMRTLNANFVFCILFFWYWSSSSSIDNKLRNEINQLTQARAYTAHYTTHRLKISILANRRVFALDRPYFACHHIADCTQMVLKYQSYMLITHTHAHKWIGKMYNICTYHIYVDDATATACLHKAAHVNVCVLCAYVLWCVPHF